MAPKAFHDSFKSVVEGTVWPGIPGPRGAAISAMQHQLEESQWWPAADIRVAQFQQLQGLLRHAAASVPYYRKRFAAEGIDPAKPLNDEAWAKIPLLTRREIQSAAKELWSTAVPKAHGPSNESSTSGSTGAPVTIKGTQLTQFFWLCFTLRDLRWHGFELGKTFSAIRHLKDNGGAYPEGTRNADWGPAVSPVFNTGPSLVLNIMTPVADQAEWLQRKAPNYLLTYPSNLMELLDHCRQHKIRLPELRAVESFGEILFPEMREAAREVWGVPILNTYSSQELGYLALQCPKHEHLHVQAENVLLEILDDDNRPCRPGQTGRVVVTALHNFAMPLIRYSIGDFATAGAPCDCGRGLPVLDRIQGRVRNMMTLPSGAKLWPYFGGHNFPEVAPIRQYQLVQKSLTELELRVISDRKLTATEEDAVRGIITAKIGHKFDIAFSYREAIARGSGGKFEDFRSELT